MEFLKVLNQPDKISPDKRAIDRPQWAGIIIHHTDIGGRKEIDEATWKKLFSGITNWLTTADKSYLSAHFHVGRYGEVVMIVDPRTHVAYHAGESSWYHPILRKLVPGWNQYSIGIEILGDGNLHKYSEQQYVAVAELISALLVDFPTIDPRCITGHENIAPGRKQDPGKYFDWRKLFRKIKWV